MCTVCGIGVLLINLIVTLSPSVNLKVGPGIVPLNVQVLTTFPGAISSSASCAINVYSFLVGDVVVVVELLLALPSASDAPPFISLLLSIRTIPKKKTTPPNTTNTITIPHNITIPILLFIQYLFFYIFY